MEYTFLEDRIKLAQDFDHLMLLNRVYSEARDAFLDLWLVNLQSFPFADQLMRI